MNRIFAFLNPLREKRSISGNRLLLLLLVMVQPLHAELDLTGWSKVTYDKRDIYLPSTVGAEAVYSQYQGIYIGHGKGAPLWTGDVEKGKSQDWLDYFHSKGFILMDAYNRGPDSLGDAKRAELRIGFFEIIQPVLDAAAADLDHPEITGLHFIITGCSRAGTISELTGQAVPERCIAILPLHGDRGYIRRTGQDEDKRADDPIWQVPCLYISGGADATERLDAVEALTRTYRKSVRKSANGPWSRIIQPQVAHCDPEIVSGEPRYNFNQQYRFALEWLDAVIDLRVDHAHPAAPLAPIDVSEGWLGIYDPINEGVQDWGEPFGNKGRFLNARIAAHDEVPEAERGDWIWLPNEALAQRWKIYCDEGTLGSESADLGL